MEFAVNYSPILAELVQEGKVCIDRFKCPAWPDLLAEARQVLPVYIHFPLTIGNGTGGPIDDEQKQPADLDRFAELLEQTGTPLVNTHFVPAAANYPGIDISSHSARDIERVLSNTLRDLEPLLKRFGPERVTIENIINEWGWLTMAVMPEVITRLLDESGCGFLFDLSHARLAARSLGLDERTYVSALPVDRIREIHITGLQLMAGDLYDRLMAAGNPGGFAGMMAGKWMDHLPMTDADWPVLEWMMAQLRAGQSTGSHWKMPWVIASEIGGVGGFWEQISNRAIYLDQVPRMAAIIHGNDNDPG